MNDVNGDVGRQIEADWGDFGERLTAHLTGMVAGAILTIGVIVGRPPLEGSTPYLQVRRPDGALPRVEVSGNAHLAPGHALDTRALRRLRRRGFSEASEQDLFGHADNHCLVAASDGLEDLAELSGVAIGVLRDVLGVIHPTMLEVTGSGDGSRWAGLAHVPPPETTAYPPPPRVTPGNAEDLRDLIGQGIAHWTAAPAQRDEDGDYAATVARCPFWVGASTKGPLIDIVGFVVTHLTDRGAARRLVRGLNERAMLGTYSVHKDAVRLDVSLPAAPFVFEHLHFALQVLEGQLEADVDRLARKVGGRVPRVDAA